MTTFAALARCIEHTLLTPTASVEAVETLCAEAIEHSFAGVCVHPIHVARCAERVAGSGRLVVSVVGFPLGTLLSESKAFECARAVADGAHEIDMVLRVDALLAGAFDVVRADIAAVVASASGRAVKVILETGYLNDAQIVVASQLAVEAGAAFVKTSTGFGPRGASEQDIRLMRSAVGAGDGTSGVGVKASGGIRTRTQAEAMLRAGANRIGTSAGKAILLQA